ncbi:phosphotransferase enzyme family-domain-containing protein [Aspergillus varians]
MPPARGLEWKPTLFGLQPRWTEEPQLTAIEAVARSLLGGDEEVRVSFFTQGGFNKLYTIEQGTTSYIMRISLPVDPHRKTESEVATIQFVQENSKLPVPAVRYFNSSQSGNALGFEWILMDRIPGFPLSGKWKSMAWSTKEQLVKQVARFTAGMFRSRFNAIGNLFSRSSGQDDSEVQTENVQSIRPLGLDPGAEISPSVTVGQIVSVAFFWGDRLSQDVPRGPFQSSREWIESRLTITENESKQTVSTSDDEDDIEVAEDTIKLVKRLNILLPRFFPIEQGAGEPEQTMLYHHDLSKENILVTDSGTLAGVVDWESVSVLPLWKACDYPAFLRGKSRDEKPDKEKYHADENGEPGNIYWEHLLEYELTQLRALFSEVMQTLEPEWCRLFESGRAKRDYDVAVHNCNSELWFPQIREWLNNIEAGKNGCSLAF